MASALWLVIYGKLINNMKLLTGYCLELIGVFYRIANLKRKQGIIHMRTLKSIADIAAIRADCNVNIFYCRGGRIVLFAGNKKGCC